MKKRLCVVGLIVSLVAITGADTFRHKETGEVFYGFRLQKRTADKILAYDSDQKKTRTIEEKQYEITLDSHGRRDTVVRVSIQQPEILVSKVVSDRVAELIIEASNTGPQLIVVEIDSPGGCGEYMKTIASAIEQTTNCPVVAYITGGQHGGAYAAAGVIALACDKIYIAPSAAIGAVGPMTGSVSTGEQYTAFLSQYSSDTLAAYGVYAAAVVKNPDLRLIARALVDKTVSVVEVVDTTTNKTQFVERQDRRPFQTIVRTLAEGTSRIAPDGTASPQSLQPADIIGRVLTLTASDAVRIGLAEMEASSVTDIMAAWGIKDARLTNVPDIKATIKRFIAGRRSIGQSLDVIDRLENYASTLEEQIARVEDQLRTGTVTREVSSVSRPTAAQRRGRVMLPDNYYNYYGSDGITVTRDRLGRSMEPRGRRQALNSVSVTSDQPVASLQMLRNEQAIVLRDLISEYRKVIGLARRWPGGLPQELPVQTLEANMNSAAALLDYVTRYALQPYRQTQNVQQPISGPARR
jgi:ATP-dependent protease ClpP protease subunit